MKINKTSFIIVRVTDIEKDYLLKLALKAKQGFSNFIRCTSDLLNDYNTIGKCSK